jgi:tight adherence protein B
LEGIAVLVMIAEIFYSSLAAVLFLLPLMIPIYLRRKRIQEEKKRGELVMEFKECMNSVLTALKAGYSCENAFREAEKEMNFLYGGQSEICRELLLIRGGLDSNVTLESLLNEFAARSDSEEIHDFAEVFMIARRSGGNMTEILIRTTTQIQDRIDVEREISILVSSKKLEQIIMDVVPFGIIAYIGISSRGFFDVLYHNPVGILVMTICLFTYTAAFWLSEQIIAIRV